MTVAVSGHAASLKAHKNQLISAGPSAQPRFDSLNIKVAAMIQT